MDDARRLRPRRRGAASVVLAAATLAMAACGGTELVEGPARTTTTTAPPTGLGVTASPLAGLRSARVGAARPGDLAEQLRTMDPQAGDVNAGAAGYDTVMLVALAAEVGRSDAPGSIATALFDVSRKGEACTTFPRCRRLAEELADLDYDGRSGGVQFLDNGDVGEATFEIQEITPSGARKVIDETTVQATALSRPGVVPDRQFGPAADGVLRIGTLLPTSGPQADAARSARAGVQLAVSELDRDRGVLGEPVQLVPDESGDGSSEATKAAVARLIAAGVDVVVGGSTQQVDEVAVGPLSEAGIVIISPTDAFRGLSALPDRGLYFRVAPSDELEGMVLGRMVADDGYTEVAIVSPTTSPARDLALDVNAAVNAAGGEAVGLVPIDPGGDAVAAADQVLASGAQAVVFVTPTTTTAAVLQELVRRGKGPGKLPAYAASATVNDELVTLLGDG